MWITLYNSELEEGEFFRSTATEWREGWVESMYDTYGYDIIMVEWEEGEVDQSVDVTDMVKESE